MNQQKTVERTEFQEMLAYCRANKTNVGTVVVYNLSRFSRSAHDHAIIRLQLHNLGITLRSVMEPIDDTSTGKLMETVFQPSPNSITTKGLIEHGQGWHLPSKLVVFSIVHQLAM